jgi:serine/threonine protein kinase
MMLEATGKRVDVLTVGRHDAHSSLPRPHGLAVGQGTHRRDRSGQLVAGRYRILRLLGRGGMGWVWLAVDCVLRRPVALKEAWRPEGTTDGGQEGSPLREARAVCAVTHPGVVQVYDLVVEGGREWIVMEALSGSTLAEAIRQQGRLPVPRVVDIGLRLLEALQAVHREGLVHGDLKPSNVQLEGTGRPVLTDFGLASGAGDAAWTEVGHFVGSPPYTAPEVIRTGIRSPASDLFALGATLYHAAEGRRPFEDEGPVAITLAVLHHSPTPALDAAPLGQLIDGLLVKDPHQRLRAPDAYAWLKEIESELTWSTPGVGSSLDLVAG